MEMSGQSYLEVVSMPVRRFYDYVTWKAKLEEEKRKIIKDTTKDLKVHKPARGR